MQEILYGTIYKYVKSIEQQAPFHALKAYRRQIDTASMHCNCGSQTTTEIMMQVQNNTHSVQW
jgi:hypothetical protein